MTLHEKLQSLIAKSNTTTGESDSDLTSAIIRLCNGYSEGGDVVLYKEYQAIPIQEVIILEQYDYVSSETIAVFDQSTLVFTPYKIIVGNAKKVEE